MRHVVLSVWVIGCFACGDPQGGGEPTAVDAGTTGACIDGEQTCEDPTPRRAASVGQGELAVHDGEICADKSAELRPARWGRSRRHDGAALRRRGRL